MGPTVRSHWGTGSATEPEGVATWLRASTKQNKNLNKPTAKKKSAISGRFGLIKVNGKLKKCGKSGRFMLIKVNGKLVLNKNFRFAIFLYFQRDFFLGDTFFGGVIYSDVFCVF